MTTPTSAAVRIQSPNSETTRPPSSNGRSGRSGRGRSRVRVGPGSLARQAGSAILSLAEKAATSVGAIKDGWNGFSILHTSAARVGALDIGFLPAGGGPAGPPRGQGRASGRGFELT